jgi:hypothetical protein
MSESKDSNKKRNKSINLPTIKKFNIDILNENIQLNSKSIC